MIMTITVKEAAKKTNYSKAYIYDLIRNGELSAFKEKGKYQIKENKQLERYLPEEPEEKAKKIYCKEGKKCVWSTDNGKKEKYYCPFPGCIENG